MKNKALLNLSSVFCNFYECFKFVLSKFIRRLAYSFGIKLWIMNPKYKWKYSRRNLTKLETLLLLNYFYSILSNSLLSIRAYHWMIANLNLWNSFSYSRNLKAALDFQSSYSKTINLIIKTSHLFPL